MNYGQGSGYVKRNSPQFAFNRACFPTPVGSLVGPLIGGRSSSSISMRGRRMRRGSCNMRATNSSSEVLSRPMSTEQLESAQREQGFRKKTSRCRQTADFERYARRAILHQIIYWIDRRLNGLAGPDYDATISFGLPFEPEDSQYGESRLIWPSQGHGDSRERRPLRNPTSLEGLTGIGKRAINRKC